MQNSFLEEIINLKVKIIFLLRKNYESNTDIYPKLLSKIFHKTKGSISIALKQLLDQNLIQMIKKGAREKREYRKRILLTREGYLTATRLLYEALNPKEILVIKSLNLGKHNQ